MSKDFRVTPDYFTHPKTIKAERALGESAPLLLLRLMAHASVNKPTGVLTGMDNEDIAIAAGWKGDPDLLVETWVRVGQLDRLDDGTLTIHDWQVHNPFVAGAEERSANAKAAANARWGKDQKAGNARSNNTACGEHASALPSASTSNAPSPCPSPDPSPLPSPDRGDRTEVREGSPPAPVSISSGVRLNRRLVAGTSPQGEGWNFSDADLSVLVEAGEAIGVPAREMPTRILAALSKHDGPAFDRWHAMPPETKALWCHKAVSLGIESKGNQGEGLIGYISAIIRERLNPDEPIDLLTPKVTPMRQRAEPAAPVEIPKRTAWW